MSFSVPIALRCVASMPLLSGTGILVMGLGILDLDPELEAVAATVLKMDHPPLGFYVFLGTSKILGALGLWGKGLFARPRNPLSFIALGTPAACAVYGHAMLNDGKAIFAGVYLIILAAVAMLDQPNTTEDAKASDSKKK